MKLYNHTSVSLRFSGLILTLRDIDSSTSLVLEFSLLTLTRNYTSKWISYKHVKKPSYNLESKLWLP